MSLLSDVSLAPRDPILGLNETFAADPRPGTVNLGVGVYTDDDGRVPLLQCVQAAEEKIRSAAKPYGYLPIDGLKPYDQQIFDLVLDGAVDPARVVVVQSLGGTGALKVAGDFLHTVNPGATVLVSDPSWENHRSLFSRAGFTVESYPYYDAAHRAVDVDAMLAALRAAAAGTIVVLHACCHNPTGYDLTPAQWQEVLAVVQQAGLVPVLDMAYQGFATSLEADAAAPRLFAASGVVTFITNSFSKTFSLYGERVGGLSVVCADADEAARVRSQLKIVVRTNYSNPPTHGATIVATVLGDPDLRSLWESELAGMRERIKTMRAGLRAGLEQARPDLDFSYITAQNGMFSYSGLSKDQMTRLREEFGVYGLDSGRICMAALNTTNLPVVVKAITAVL